MPADSLNRKTVRDAMVALLTAKLITDPDTQLAQDVIGYRPADFGGKSPVVVVTSGGSERIAKTLGTKWHSRFLLYVYTFVLYSDEDSNWNEEDAEDAGDVLEKHIADVVMDNRKGTYWDSLLLREPSVIDSVEISGVEYKMEVMQLVAEAFVA